jgi:hypothetical protein
LSDLITLEGIRIGGKLMDEWEALIQRREMLQEKVSKINYEVEKIDKRLTFLGKMPESERFDLFQIQEHLAREVS